jgi:hypothetical protein
MFKSQFPIFYKSDFLEGKCKSVAVSGALGLQRLTESGLFAEHFRFLFLSLAEPVRTGFNTPKSYPMTTQG